VREQPAKTPDARPVRPSRRRSVSASRGMVAVAPDASTGEPCGMQTGHRPGVDGSGPSRPGGFDPSPDQQLSRDGEGTAVRSDRPGTRRRVARQRRMSPGLDAPALKRKAAVGAPKIYRGRGGVIACVDASADPAGRRSGASSGAGAARSRAGRRRRVARKSGVSAHPNARRRCGMARGALQAWTA